MPDEGQTGDGAKRITAGDILSVILSSSGTPLPASEFQKNYLEQFRERSIEAQISYAHLKGIQEHYRHKGYWSYALMAAIGLMLVFQIVLLICVGLEVLDFTKYKWLLPALLVQNLGQVIGLAVYAVKYLFSDITGQKPK